MIRFGVVTLWVAVFSFGSDETEAAGRTDPWPDDVPVSLKPALAAALAPDDYAITRSGPGEARWVARNERNGLEASFDRDGVRITSAADPGAAPLLTFRFESWGFEDAPRKPAASPFVAEGSRIEARRGPVVEWYVNAPNGIEQGFTVEEPPPSTSPRGPLEFHVALGGTLSPRIDDDRRGLRLIDPEGEERLRYSGLAAWDSTGRTLPARLDLRDAAVVLRVDVDGARFPITVDPVTWTQEHLVPLGKSGGDEFGSDVAIDGDTAIVGSWKDDHESEVDAGSAYVFVWNGSSWAQEAKLIASDASAGANFGLSVSLHGDTAVVGAWKDTLGTTTTPFGSAYVFVRSGTTWTQQAKLTSPNVQADGQFGRSVSVHGETVLVGAAGENSAGGVDAGKAYVFVRSDTAWSLQAVLQVAESGMGQFGRSSALYADTALVGAYEADHGGVVDTGAAYVFVRQGTNWSQQAKLTAADAASGDLFGYSVDLCADDAIVTAPLDDDNGPDAGAAYVFVRNGTVWTQQSKLAPSFPQWGAQFGTSAAIDGDWAVVGSKAYDHFSAVNAGRAYVFVRDGSTWSEVSALSGYPDFYDEFGWAVDICGPYALVGAWFDEEQTIGQNSGDAYMFHLGAQVTSHGAGCAGSGGFVPVLTLTEAPQPAGAVTLSLTNGLGGSMAVLLVGAVSGDTPVGGGCSLLVTPLFPLAPVVPLDGAGAGFGTFSIPATLPATAEWDSVALQAAVADPLAVLGFSMTNGVLLKLP